MILSVAFIAVAVNHRGLAGSSTDDRFLALCADYRADGRGAGAGNDRCRAADCGGSDCFVTDWNQTSRAVERLKHFGSNMSSFIRHISPAVAAPFRLC